MTIKRLKDYPKDQWIEAADGCEYCGAKYEVQITRVDESQNFGEVFTRIRHKEGCPERYDYETGLNNQKITSNDIAGWEFKDKPVKLSGKEFIPLKSRANIGPCLSCWKLVIGVPLILFIDQGKGGELDFCPDCFKKLGLVKYLK